MRLCATLLFAALSWSTQDRIAAVDRAEAALVNYYYLDKIAAIKGAVENRRASLLAIDDQKEFAKTLTDTLQKASGDLHFIVWYSDHADSNQTPQMSAAEKAANDKFFRYVGEGHSATVRLQGNVGYLRMGGFAELAGARDTIDGAMAALSNTDAMIVDMRSNGGGDSDTVDYLLGYFFAKPIIVAHISQRVNGKVTVQEERSKVVHGRPYLAKPVYVLVGKPTISGGEMFAYTMQCERAATIVGESTAGAANGLSQIPAFLGEHLRLSVPDTMITSPITKTNWEGGVQPDVVTSAEGALLYAYTQALHKVPQTYDPVGELKKALTDPASALRNSFPSGV